jgi:HB1, ASXL, restriction endonuclease HTH domain
VSDGRRSARAAQRVALAARDSSAGPPLPRRRRARPNSKDEEKEAITMAKQTAKGVSAKQVAVDVLRAAAGPLKAKEIAKRVIDSGRCAGLKGKTPEATISAMLAVGSKPGGPFKRVDKGTYALTDAPTPPATGGGAQKRAAKPPTQKRAAKPRTQKRQPAKRTG